VRTVEKVVGPSLRSRRVINHLPLGHIHEKETRVTSHESLKASPLGRDRTTYYASAFLFSVMKERFVQSILTITSHGNNLIHLEFLSTDPTKSDEYAKGFVE
jgi:hypothetical protein